jgi:hypothetical protein
MATAKICINPDGTEWDLETPEGERFGNFAVDGDVIVECEDGTLYIAVGGEHDTLETNSVYKLVKVDSNVETGVELDEEEESADDEENDDEDEDGE